jgi:hypothetical protein
MPNLPWPGRTIFQIALIGSAHGSQIVNTLHFQAGSAIIPPIMSDDVAFAASEELAALWETVGLATWKSCHPTDYALNMIRCQVIERPGEYKKRLTPVEMVPTGGAAAGSASSSEEMSAAAVVRWRTTLAGKRFRGRMYIGPLPANYSDNGRLATAGMTTVNAHALALKNAFAVGGSSHNEFALTIYSRSYNEGEYGYPQGVHPSKSFFYPPDYAGNATNVTTYAVDSVLRTQRRRQIGVGA